MVSVSGINTASAPLAIPHLWQIALVQLLLHLLDQTHYMEPLPILAVLRILTPDHLLLIVQLILVNDALEGWLQAVLDLFLHFLINLHVYRVHLVVCWYHYRVLLPRSLFS